RLRPDVSRTASSAYESFALLSGLWRDPNTQAAIQLILSQPHSDWTHIIERRSPGRSFPPSSKVAHQLVHGTPRREWSASPVPQLSTVPLEIDFERAEATFDTTANRFAKFVLRRWEGLLLDLHDVVAKRSMTPARRRGDREIAEILGEIQGVLAEPLFTQVGA